ncbi:PorT family protein [Chitinophagales bacterium]|nr:PorT family protein [Chitinophagales bacterium]
MRKILCSVLLLCSFVSAQAQIIEDITIGIFARPMISYLRAENPQIDGGSDFGWELGTVVDYALNDRYFITTGLQYSKIQAPLEALETDQEALSKMSFRLGYLQIPIAFKGKTNEFSTSGSGFFRYSKFFGQFGISPSILVDGRFDRDRPDDAGEIINGKIDGIAKPITFTWNLAVGLEYALEANTALFTSVYFDRSFSNLLYDEAMDIANDDDKVIFASLGLRIGIYF